MSIKLTLILSGRTLDRFEFDDDFARLRVGRSEDCEVRIDNLGVSRHHCEIVRQEGYVVLRDLQSNNGTFVNGGKVEVHNLNDGDVITLGKYSLEYQGPPPPGAKGLLVSESSEPDGALTVQVDPAALARMAGGKATRVRGHFVLEPRGKEKPRTLVLEKPVFLLGKDQDADLRLEGWFCPRVVAVVLRDDTGFRLLDVTERGDAVRVNGTKRRDVRLTDQDEVQVRDRRLKFLRGSPNAADT
ncbi:MAG: FHA domain-containing protein [Planctomycetota bacterium]|nr:FHA domain-containing protein [Planctomycetota bacterium]